MSFRQSSWGWRDGAKEKSYTPCSAVSKAKNRMYKISPHRACAFPNWFVEMTFGFIDWYSLTRPVYTVALFILKP